MQKILLFLSTMVAFFLMDMTWLGFIAKNLYADNIGLLMRKTGDAITPNWYAAIIVYIIFALGILLFVLPKADGQYSQALLWGALFGFITYGVYDFTNYSTLANWPLQITLIDLAWGTFLCSIVSVFAAYMQKVLG